MARCYPISGSEGRPVSGLRIFGKMKGRIVSRLSAARAFSRLAQDRGLAGRQAVAGVAPGARDASAGGPERGKEPREDHLRARAERADLHISAGMEAFHRHAVGHDDLVPREKEVDVAHRAPVTGAVAKQRLGRGQHLAAAEMQLGAPVLHQQPVLRRDQRVARGPARAEGVPRDTDRAQPDRPRRDPPPRSRCRPSRAAPGRRCRA
jgi:hypothetical protein